MAEGDFTITVNAAGKSIVVEFWIQGVIADWWLSEIRERATVQVWKGGTDDNVADAVAIDPKSLNSSANLNWLVVLFGPQQDRDVSVVVDARQDGTLLGQSTQTVSVKAKTSKQLTGTITIG